MLIKPQPVAGPGLRRWAWIFAALVFVQILAGGLVAGLNAGLAYNSFPTMNGQWVPDGHSGDAAGLAERLRERHDGAVQPPPRSPIC